MTSVKQKLIEDEELGWRELCARVNRLSGDEWLSPGVNGEWNAKDLLAHIAVWHASATDRLEAYRATGSLPPLPADVDTMNQEHYERCRDLTLREVQAMSGAARHRFREEMALVPDDPGERLSMLIVGDGHEHYEEHIPQLDAFIGISS